MSRLVDLMKLGSLPGGYRIFLRRNYDQLGRVLRQAAKLHRLLFLKRTRMIVVVGSLGKTSTCLALRVALGCPQRRFSYSNYGSSLAENLLRVRPRDPHAVLEVGVAGPGQMQPHSDMISPDVVVVTSIKSEHSRSFPTLLETRAEKVRMVAALPADGLAILNGDDPHVRWMATQTKARVIFFGLEPENDVRATDISTLPDGTTSFLVSIGNDAVRVRSPLVGVHLVYPILAAFAAAHLEKLPLDGVISRLGALVPERSRMQLLALPNGIRIFDDSYKSALESMHAAFDTFARVQATRKILVMGNVEEPPGRERDVYRDLGARAARFADLVVCIGKDSMGSFRAAAVQGGMNRSDVLLVGSRIDPVAEVLRSRLRPGDAVLIKGASTQKLRRIVLQLMGGEVGCSVKYCDVKVRGCDLCPLLKSAEPWQQNRFVRRSVKP